MSPVWLELEVLLHILAARDTTRNMRDLGILVPNLTAFWLLSCLRSLWPSGQNSKNKLTSCSLKPYSNSATVLVTKMSVWYLSAGDIMETKGFEAKSLNLNTIKVYYNSSPADVWLNASFDSNQHRHH